MYLFIVLEIEEGIRNVHDEAGLSDIFNRLQSMESLLHRAETFLPPHDLKNVMNMFNSLRREFEDHRSRLFPKKNFEFSKSHQLNDHSSIPIEPHQSNEESRLIMDSNSVETNKRPTTESHLSPPPFPSMLTESLYVIRDLAHQEIRLDDHRIFGREVLLSRLIDCTIQLETPLLNLRVEDVHQCVIQVGPVNGPIIIENCEMSKFQLAGRQLRIHQSRDLSMFIYVTTGPIIEECERIQFGIYSLDYDCLDAHFEVG